MLTGLSLFFICSRSEMSSSASDVDANSETLDSDSQKPLIDGRSVSTVASINQDDGSDVPDHRGNALVVIRRMISLFACETTTYFSERKSSRDLFTSHEFTAPSQASLSTR